MLTLGSKRLGATAALRLARVLSDSETTTINDEDMQNA
jgi:hypothetical protein